MGLRHPKASLWASRSLSGTQRPPRPAPPTAQALSKAGGASCPDTQGARQPPSKADEASPPGLAPQPAFGGPGISGRLASRPGIHLTPPATALITRVGPAGQRPAGSLPGVRLKTKRRAVGDPDTNYLHLRSQGVLGRLLPLDQKQTGNGAGGSAGGGLPSGGGRQGHPSASSPLYARGPRPQHRSARGAFQVETVTRASVPGCAEGRVRGGAGTRTWRTGTQILSLRASPECPCLQGPGFCAPPKAEVTTPTGGPGGRGLGDEALRLGPWAGPRSGPTRGRGSPPACGTASGAG